MVNVLKEGFPVAPDTHTHIKCAKGKVHNIYIGEKFTRIRVCCILYMRWRRLGAKEAFSLCDNCQKLVISQSE